MFVEGILLLWYKSWYALHNFMLSTIFNIWLHIVKTQHFLH